MNWCTQERHAGASTLSQLCGHGICVVEKRKDLGGALIDEDVVEVAVAQADEVAGHGVDGRGACVRQPLLKPGRRLPEVLQEEVVQARREPRTHLHAPR